MLFAVNANCSTLTRTSPSAVWQRDKFVFVRFTLARSTRKSVVSTCMTRVFHNRLKSSSTFRVSRRECSTSKTTANSGSSPWPIFAVPSPRPTEPHQLRAYLPVVAFRRVSLPALFPVSRLGCALRHVSVAVCVWRHLHAWQGSPLRRRATFDACPALSCGTSLGSSSAVLQWCGALPAPVFPGLALGRRTFLTLRHMLPV
jgi:hypothetical protein